MPNFRKIPEKEFVLLTPKFGTLEKCCEFQSFENVRNKNGRGLSSTEKVNLSFGFNDSI